MKLEKKSKPKLEIPTASMPDIVFMLLLFFMVSTVLRTHEGLNVVLPSAKRIEKLDTKRHVTYLWVSKDNLISVDGKIMDTETLRGVMYQKRVEDPEITISIRADQQVSMGLMNEIHNELREADALKVNYSSKPAV